MSVDGQSNTSRLLQAQERLHSGGREGLSCSRRVRGGRRCCWRGGREGPGRTATHLGWPALEAAVDEGQTERNEWQRYDMFISVMLDENESSARLRK